MNWNQGYINVDALDEDMPTLRKLEALQLYRWLHLFCFLQIHHLKKCDVLAAIWDLEKRFDKLLFSQELHLAPPRGNWVDRTEGGELNRNPSKSSFQKSKIIKFKRGELCETIFGTPFQRAKHFTIERRAIDMM